MRYSNLSSQYIHVYDGCWTKLLVKDVLVELYEGSRKIIQLIFNRFRPYLTPMIIDRIFLHFYRQPTDVMIHLKLHLYNYRLHKPTNLIKIEPMEAITSIIFILDGV